MKKQRMLVHICCAPDALYVMELLHKDYDVSGFFYNPNIHPPMMIIAGLRLLKNLKMSLKKAKGAMCAMQLGWRVQHKELLNPASTSLPRS